MSNFVLKSLEDVLSTKESDDIPAHIFTKIKTCFEENLEEYLTCKALFESFKFKHEQKSSALAKELEDCKTILTADQAKLAAVQTELTALNIKYESAETELLKLQDTVGRLEYENNELHRKQVDAEDERNSLIKIVERRKVEVERLELDLKRLREDLTTAHSARFEALAVVDGVKSHEASLNIKEQAMQNEREYYLTKIDNLTKDVNHYESEMSNLRKDHALRLLTLETQLAAKTEELRIAAEKDQRLTENNRELTSKVEDLAARVMTMRESEAAMNENYQQELESKIKLVELYKSMVDDLNGKIEELTEAVHCLQNLVEEAGKHCDEVEAKRTEEQEKHEELVEAKNKCIAALKNELKDANNLINALRQGTGNNLINALRQDTVEMTGEEVRPATAAISKLIKSGLTMTQIYTQFLSVGEELLNVKEENKKLNQTISAIFKELEEKAPVMLEQNQNYENAVECVTSVCKQNDDLIEECHQLRAELNELKRSAGNHQTEKDLLRQQVQDLSRQNCFLLKEIEEAHGGVVRLDMDVSPNDYTEANDVISDRLVIFRDVIDLQAKNTQLLTVLRRLSARLEELEKAQKDVDVSTLHENIEHLNSEVSNLRESSLQLEQKLEEVGQQRDMYRDMYEDTLKGVSTSQQVAEISDSTQACATCQQVQLGGSLGAKTTSTTLVCSSVVSAKEVRIQELVQRLEETEVKLKAVKTLNNELREERQTREQMWFDQMKAWTDNIQKLTTENFNLVAQGECEVEKRKAFKKTIDGQKKEIAALEEKCANYTKTIAEHEQTIKQLADETRASQAKLARAKVEVGNLREENRLLREAEARISLEKESSERESTSRAVLMTHIDSIKMMLEKSEAEGMKRLEVRLDDADRECKALRKRLLEEQNHFRALAAELKRKTESTVVLREKDRAIAEQASSEALMLRRELSKAHRELEEKDKLISQLRDAAPTPTVVVQKKDESGVRMRELEGKLASATNQLKSLQDQLAEAKEHCRQYRGISESLESQLQELKVKHENEVAELEKALSATRNAEKDLKEKLELMEDRIAEMEVDGNEAVMELSQRADQVETELEEMRKEKAVAEQERDEVRVQLDEMAAQLLSATDARKMAEEKYADEVVRHTEDVEAQDALRRELSARETEVAELRATNERLQQELAARHASLEDLGRQMDDELGNVRERLDEVNAQNSMLHDQLRVLGAQLALFQGKAPASEVAPDQGNSTQLLEVIDFLRRESHASTTRVATLDAENKRLRSEVEDLTKQAVEAKEALREAERKVATEKAASLRHAEMLRQVEMIATIKESNKALRAERDALREKEQQLEERAAQLESKLAPLEEQNRSLTSQADSARAENVALSEVNKQLRARMKGLLERANKTSLEDSKRLQGELAAERDAHNKTREEARNVRQEKAKLEELQNAANRRIASLESDLRGAQANAQKQTEELGVLRAKVTGLEVELTQQQTVQSKMAADMKKLEEVRRIARRYKTQYDEVNKKNEELQKELSERQQAEAAAPGSALLSAEAQEQLREEGRRLAEEKLKATQTSQEEQSRGSEQRLADQEAASNELLVQAREEVDTLRQENEALRQREENLRNVMMKVRTRLTTLDSDKTKLEQQLKEANTASQLHLNDSEENKKRFNVLKSQYESKLARMEKDKADALAERGERERSERERLQRELDTMTARCSLLQRQLDKQSGKQNAGSGPEKGSTEPPPTPPTANIKPMAGPSSAPPKQQTQQAATVPPWRSGNETPLASIRPIQSRMAAVSPQTTSNLQLQPSTAVLVPMQSPTQHHIPTGQPQSQQPVQPQPPPSQFQAVAQQPTLVHAVAPAGVSAQVSQLPAPSQPPTPSQPPAPSQMPAPSQPPVAVQPATDPTPVALPSGSGSMEATSSRADVVPATTSSTEQQVGAVPSTSREDGAGAQSTQDMDVEGGSSMVGVAALPSVPQAAPPAVPTPTIHAPQPTTPQAKQQQATIQRSSSQQPSQQHAVAMVMPRERTEQPAQQQVAQAVAAQPQQPPLKQPTATAAVPVEAQQQSSQLASSSSAVTTSGSQGSLKRSRESEGEGSQGRTEPEKVVPQTKRSRRGLVPGELFQAVESSDCGRLEVEYQVPTSSQRDQEDDVIVITSDEDEDDEDERIDEEDSGEEDSSDEGEMEMEGYPIESYDQDDLGTYDEGESSDEERDVDNEVEIIDDSDEVPSQTVSGDPGRADFNQAVGSSLVLPQQVGEQPEEPEQRSEATSSGVEGRGGHGTPVGSGSMSRSGVVTSQGLLFLGRGRTTNQQQLLLPHGYEGDTSDDSIVPSTPTLYDPRRVDTDGFGVAVSSPQVPSAGRFTFSESNQPTTARAGASQVGCEGIDHTRMDLSQLEETGTERSVPTTPLHVSRQDESVGETFGSTAAGQSGDSAVVIAVSEAGPSEGSAAPLIPAVTVTGTGQQLGEHRENLEPEEPEQISEEPPQEPGENPIHDIDEENGDGVSSEGQNMGHPLRPLVEEGREAEASTASSPQGVAQGGPHGREPAVRGAQTARRISRVGFARRGRAVARQKQPIVWTEPGSSATSSRAGSSSTSALESETVYRSGMLGRGMTQNQAYPSRGQRGRRMRTPGFRGFPPF